jgi:two-component system chemotaxis sensor kinase CheA
MDLMGEIVITESMVVSIPTEQGVDMDSFNKASRQLQKLIDELQEDIMAIRMVPVSSVFQKMRRIVRDMSKKLDKDVELILEGEDTEVDKTIVDGIADPLMHLVRNAMDHGIETKAERIASGKPEKGRITLSAQNTGGEILVSICDDGKGYDRGAILKKAKLRGLLKKSESEYTDKETYAFLMMPGFSTKEKVTEYSGRGVGMDVVKKNIEKSGGEVMLDCVPGEGASIHIKIPLTLAIVNGMKISVGDSIFTIPINNIKQSMKVDKSNIIEDNEKNESILIRDICYPIVRLHKNYNIETLVTDITDGIIILVESSEASYCIFADALLGEQQVVIKPLPSYLSQYNVKEQGISGCAILGDGSISLILDILNLLKNN